MSSLSPRLTADGIRIVCDRLVGEVGGYLRNAVRERGVTCSVCAGPVVPPFVDCRRCQMDRTRFGDQLADLVVPVCYGIKGAQSGHLMWMYKHPTAPVRRNRTLLAMLLVAALAVHERCIEHRLGREIDAWAVVPSTCGRAGEHPLHQLARTARFSYPEIRLGSNPRSDTGLRATGIDRFHVCDPDAAQSRHVLVVDDTWATGAHSQSAALGLKHAGAELVTVLVLARWLNPHDHAPSAEVVRSRLVRDYDPLVCPVSGGTCQR